MEIRCAHRPCCVCIGALFTPATFYNSHGFRGLIDFVNLHDFRSLLELPRRALDLISLSHGPREPVRCFVCRAWQRRSPSQMPCLVPNSQVLMYLRMYFTQAQDCSTCQTFSGTAAKRSSSQELCHRLAHARHICVPSCDLCHCLRPAPSPRDCGFSSTTFATRAWYIIWQAL